MRLFLYVAREYLKFVVGTLVLTLFLFILFDFIHKTTKYFSEYNPTPENILLFYAYQIPSQLVQALPIAALIAGVVSMILLSRTNEVTAMRASGMGPVRIALPLVIGGLGLSIVSLIVNDRVVPLFATKMHYVQQVLIEGESDTELAGGARWLRDGQVFYSFDDYDPVEKVLDKVQIMKVDRQFQPKEAITATKASFDEEGKQWRLERIERVHFKRTGELNYVEKMDDQSVTMPLFPQNLKKERRKPNELSLNELGRAIKTGRSGGKSTLSHEVDYHVKIAYSFATLVVSLIGLRFGYKSERATETARGVLLAFGMGVLYWFVLSSGRALGKHGDISPIAGAWLANFAIMSFVVVDFVRSRKS